MFDVFDKPAPIKPLDQALIAAYEDIGLSVDELPYTSEFDRLVERVEKATGDKIGCQQALQRLFNLRKAARLSRMGRGSANGSALPDENRDLLQRLIVQSVGSLGGRDRLPYTENFDELRERFVETTGRNISNHDFWRLIARVTK